MTIERVVFGGRGLARTDLGVVLVSGVLPGEVVEVRITHRSSGALFAEVVAFRELSPRRIKAPCPFYADCGGCSMQHAEYALQLEIKLGQVRETLERLGKIESPPLTGIEPCPDPFGYRNRITVHAHRGRVGFHRRDGRGLVDIDQCLLASEPVNRALAELRTKGRGSGHYTLRAPGLSRAFHQTNKSVASLLRDWVLSHIPDPTPLLVDAYCGAGYFGRAAASKCQSVVGIDHDLYNIEEATENATHNERYLCAPVEQELGSILDAHREAVLLVDPPREGLSKDVREIIALRPPAAFIYVSCDPATLARDAAAFSSVFQMTEARAFDMFPQTAEIETAAVFTRKS